MGKADSCSDTETKSMSVQKLGKIYFEIARDSRTNSCMAVFPTESVYRVIQNKNVGIFCVSQFQSASEVMLGVDMNKCYSAC